MSTEEKAFEITKMYLSLITKDATFANSIEFTIKFLEHYNEILNFLNSKKTPNKIEAGYSKIV